MQIFQFHNSCGKDFINKVFPQQIWKVSKTITIWTKNIIENNEHYWKEMYTIYSDYDELISEKHVTLRSIANNIYSQFESEFLWKLGLGYTKGMLSSGNKGRQSLLSESYYVRSFFRVIISKFLTFWLEYSCRVFQIHLICDHDIH